MKYENALVSTTNLANFHICCCTKKLFITIVTVASQYGIILFTVQTHRVTRRETPLASCQMLRDEAEVWMDVQVDQLYTCM